MDQCLGKRKRDPKEPMLPNEKRRKQRNKASRRSRERLRLALEELAGWLGFPPGKSINFILDEVIARYTGNPGVTGDADETSGQQPRLKRRFVQQTLKERLRLRQRKFRMLRHERYRIIRIWLGLPEKTTNVQIIQAIITWIIMNVTTLVCAPVSAPVAAPVCPVDNRSVADFNSNSGVLRDDKDHLPLKYYGNATECPAVPPFVNVVDLYYL